MNDKVIFDRRINKIVNDMWDDKDITCIVCGKVITDPGYINYTVCSSKCDLKASVDEDRAQDE